MEYDYTTYWECTKCKTRYWDNIKAFFGSYKRTWCTKCNKQTDIVAMECNKRENLPMEIQVVKSSEKKQNNRSADNCRRNMAALHNLRFSLNCNCTFNASFSSPSEQRLRQFIAPPPTFHYSTKSRRTSR